MRVMYIEKGIEKPKMSWRLQGVWKQADVRPTESRSCLIGKKMTNKYSEICNLVRQSLGSKKWKAVHRNRDFLN